VIELIGTGLGTHYPYLYDWEIISDAGSCLTVLSNKIPVKIYFGGTDSLSISGLDTAYFDNDSPVTITGNPPGGYFYGPGMNGSTFDPALANTGSNVITYVYTDSLGCSDSIQKTVNVKIFSSVTGSHEYDTGIILYPNPSDGTFTFYSNAHGPIEAKITNLAGDEIMSFKTGTNEKFKKIDLDFCPPGIYFLHLISNDFSRYLKLVLN
jgi:hypothetical protein